VTRDPTTRVRIRQFIPPAALALAFCGPIAGRAAAQADSTAARTASAGTPSSQPDSERWSSFLPLLGDLARKRGIELPRPFGAGLVYYHLSRDIEISDVRVGRNGAPPTSVSEFAQLESRSDVDNVNLKLDAWLLPFLNLYGIVGYIWNESSTRMVVSLPPLLPGGSPRSAEIEVPTELVGTVGGLGMTLAGGYGPFFMIYDVNWAQADLGFDDRFRAVVSSIRGGWNGAVGSQPLQLWASATDWNTFAEAKGTVTDPDGGTLSFIVSQGPAYRYTYGLGAHYTARPWLEFAAETGSDFHSGWYLALIPVFRF
jgi:hypothetical protein